MFWQPCYRQGFRLAFFETVSQKKNFTNDFFTVLEEPGEGVNDFVTAALKPYYL
jgi:hypothetical protein